MLGDSATPLDAVRKGAEQGASAFFGRPSDRRRPDKLGETAVKTVLGQVLDSRGKLQYTSGQWTHGDLHYTVREANDRGAEGGHILSISWPASLTRREHTTIVFDADGNIAKTKSNKTGGWLQ